MKTTALQMVADGKGEMVNLNTLRAFARRGLVSLKVRVIKTSRTGREYDVMVDITDAGRAAL